MNNATQNNQEIRRIVIALTITLLGVYISIAVILFIMQRSNVLQEISTAGVISLYVSLFASIVAIGCMILQARYFKASISNLTDSIKGMQDMPVSSWRLLKQESKINFQSNVIIAINEFIICAQQTLMCRENLGRFLAHEIKTPLTNLMNEIELAQVELSKAKFKDVQAKHQNAINDIFRIRSIINNLCELAYVESGKNGDSEYPVEKLLSDAIMEFEHVYKAKVFFECDPKCNGGLININPDYFWVLCSNILRNALKHGNGLKHPPKVNLTMVNNQYKIEFCDKGPGFPETQIENKDVMPKTPGVGLALCMKLAKLLNITIDFRNDPVGGAVVSAWFEHARR